MDTPWVRLVLAISLDGRLALPKGGKTHLGNKGDRRVLEESLAWSDATLIGGGTLRAHGNTCLIHDLELIEKRKSEGRSEQPITVVVSSQKQFCPEWPFFKQPIQKWLLTSESTSVDTHALLNYERVLKIHRTWSKSLNQLKEAGLSRLVLLGGAELVGSFMHADQIDELQLTLTPKIIGGEYTWIPYRMENLPTVLSNPDSWHLKENDPLNENELLLRYFRNRSSKSNKS